MSAENSVRHDWYQTDSKVIITVLLKNAVEKNYNVKIVENHVEVTAENYTLSLDLSRNIIPEKSTHKATPHKVEIVLAKKIGERWNELVTRKENGDCGKPNSKLNLFGSRNWDQLATDFEKKEAEDGQKGEEALQQLFQKIYSNADPEVKRAMNKSYSESGGTVLSTNWKEVREKEVEVKPPDGTIYKKWEKS